jgi:hypothetical protein
VVMGMTHIQHPRERGGNSIRFTLPPRQTGPDGNGHGTLTPHAAG